MGTRHLIVVKNNKEVKVAQYAQWDGYPGGAGIDIFNFVKDKEKLNKLKEKMNKLRFLDTEKDKDFIDEFNKNSKLNNLTIKQENWFNNFISRDLSVKVLDNIINSDEDCIILKNSIDFASDSLFCEWGYSIDFDRNELIVHKGFNKTPLDETDYFYPLDMVKNNYYAIRDIKSFDLDNLPDIEEMLKLDKCEDIAVDED